MRKGNDMLHECSPIALLHEWWLMVSNQNNFRIMESRL